MIQNKRLKKLSIVLLVSILFLGATSQRANAWIIDPFESFVESSLETIETLIIELSNDIGEMADRIGEMADRIVHTEELMVNLVDDSNSSSTTVSSLITYPTEGTIVYATIPVEITLSDQSPDYILYISNNADMSASTNALVLNGDTTDAWNRVPDYATGDKLYIAIKTVSNANSSDFSNTVMLNLQ